MQVYEIIFFPESLSGARTSTPYTATGREENTTCHSRPARKDQKKRIFMAMTKRTAPKILCRSLS